jgi:signal transduction histidine kinase
VTRADSPLKTKLAVVASAAAAVTDASNVIIFEYVDSQVDKGVGKGQFGESACEGSSRPKMWGCVDFKPDAVPYRVIKGGTEIFAPIASKCSVLFHKKDNPNFIQREGIKSVAAIPLTAGSDCLGCIFFNFNQSQEFGFQQTLEIRTMAEYAAIAIHQNRLMDEKAGLVNEKSRLLRYAQHSLNQPLNALLGFLSNLSQGLYCKDLAVACLEEPERYRQSVFARRVQNQYLLCRYMVHMLNTFLHMDVIQQPDGDIFQITVKEDQNLSDLCNRAVDVAEAYRAAPISRKVEPGVVGCFDPNAVQAALLNVLINAVKYGDCSGPDKPKDAIQLHLFVSTCEGRRLAIIHVDDSGKGIPPGDRSTLFEPRDRAKSDGRGLGIGLYLARKYIEHHGGWINVDTSDAGGARFVISFPINKKEVY